MSFNFCPEFYPSKEEFSNFAKYVDTVIEPKVKKIGICKVIAPKSSFATKDFENVSFRPIEHRIVGSKGAYQVDIHHLGKMNVKEFKSKLNEEPSEASTLEELEVKFWRGMRPEVISSLYGADIEGSLFEEDKENSWNLNMLDTILRPVDLPGITKSMLYFGMWKAMFCIHTEDNNLYSINYLHCGRPKIWYAVAPQHASKLENAAHVLFPGLSKDCSAFLHHKTSLISPKRMDEFGVPYVKVFQMPGEFVITFPASYHQGFNTGFNVAEAVNFATFGWIPYGLRAKKCACREDRVNIFMDNMIQYAFSNYKKMPQKCTWYEEEDSDDWLFACKCGLVLTKDDNPNSEKMWVECTTCKIWVHLECVHPEISPLKLPDTLTCHRCSDNFEVQQEPAQSLKEHKSALKKRKVVAKRKQTVRETPCKENSSDNLKR